MNRSRSRGDDLQKRNISFRNVAQEIYLSLVITASRLSYDVDVLMKKHGLTQPQYNVLRILRGAGPDGLGRNQIRERLVTAMPDVTRLLDRMESAGLVSRKQSEVDRRQMTTCLTAAGNKLVGKIDSPLDNLHRKHVAGIRDSELRAMLAVLSNLRANAEKS